MFNFSDSINMEGLSVLSGERPRCPAFDGGDLTASPRLGSSQPRSRVMDETPRNGCLSASVNASPRSPTLPSNNSAQRSLQAPCAPQNNSAPSTCIPAPPPGFPFLNCGGSYISYGYVITCPYGNQGGNSAPNFNPQFNSTFINPQNFPQGGGGNEISSIFSGKGEFTPPDNDRSGPGQLDNVSGSTRVKQCPGAQPLKRAAAVNLQDISGANFGGSRIANRPLGTCPGGQNARPMREGDNFNMSIRQRSLIEGAGGCPAMRKVGSMRQGDNFNMTLRQRTM